MKNKNKNKRKIYNVGVTITPCANTLPDPGNKIKKAADYCNKSNKCESACKALAKEYNQQCNLVGEGNKILADVFSDIYSKSNGCTPDTKWNKELSNLVKKFEQAGKGQVEEARKAVKDKIKEKACIKNKQDVFNSIKKLEGQDDKIKKNEAELKKEAKDVIDCKNKPNPPKPPKKKANDQKVKKNKKKIQQMKKQRKKNKNKRNK